MTADTGAPVGTLRGAVFDFGGVMTESLFRRRRDADPDVLSLLVFFLNDLRSVYHLPTSTHDLHLLETGRLSEAEFFRRLCARHEEAGGPHLDPERARALIFAERAEASAAMVDTVRQLRSAGYRTALLTNNAREWEPMWRNLIPVDELFDVVVDSSVVGLRKPDPAIYELTCSRLGLRPEECIFVDDLQCNVDAAAALGMEVVHCTDPTEASEVVAQRLLGRRASAEPEE
ncbi:MAG TPA: HAD family phosphatase [Candidatus Dormibacteraeota bacterium]|nr:HAD family phosphatase [Candidatus Dormibacteraeota bacterium]